MDTLAKIIERAMADRGMDAPAVAKASGLTKQSVYNVLNGSTKWDKIRAVTLFALARALGTNDAFSLYAGPASQRAALSQSVGIDVDTLVEAEKLVAIEETIVRVAYEPAHRMRRIAALYERVRADGGQLSRQHTDDFIRAATQAGGVHNGNSETAATGRKAGAKR
jgi:transcriptional regulator with XRE-family HTH domain